MFKRLKRLNTVFFRNNLHIFLYFGISKSKITTGCKLDSTTENRSFHIKKGREAQQFDKLAVMFLNKS